jgi:hypothetical protein
LISRASERSVSEQFDQADIDRRYTEPLAAVDRFAPSADGVPG